MADAAQNLPSNEIPDEHKKNAGPATIDAKALGVWGISSIVLGNIATLLGTVGNINEQVQKIQQALNLGTTPYLLYIVLAVILAGYLLSFTSLYVWLRHKAATIHFRRPIAIAGVVFIGAISAFAINYWVLPVDHVLPVLEGAVPVWGDKLLNAQSSNGGFTVMVNTGPSNPVQVLTSAQALTAIEASMNWANPNENELNAIRSGFKYIDSRRNSKEGCWGYFDTTEPLTEICAWVVIARARALEYGDKVWPDQKERGSQLQLIRTDLESMSSHYDSDESVDGWSPFEIASTNTATASTGFGPCSAIPPELATIPTRPPTRTYSSMMAIWALSEVSRVPQIRDNLNHKYDQVVRDSIGGLIKGYQRGNDIHTFVPNPERPNQREDYLGLTAQTITVLYEVSKGDFKSSLDRPEWLQIRRDFLARDITHQLIGDNSHLSDVDGYVYPYPHPLEPITFLWAPWTLLAYRELSEDSGLKAEDQKAAKTAMHYVLRNYTPVFLERLESGPTYELAENLYGVNAAIK